MLDEVSIGRARDAVRPLARRLGLEESLRAYSRHRWTGASSDLPVLHLEDVSGIPFVSLVPGVEEYQHRARVRAADGDLFAAVTQPQEGYEEYCRSILGLGCPEFVDASGDDHPLAVATACGSGAAFDKIAAVARRAGGLIIHPYMSIQSVWTLAEAIERATGVPVQVLGPPPPTLWIANDKALLSEVVSAVLSQEWIVETHTATRPAEMARHLKRLAQRHPKVGLKRTRCASAMGNAVYDLERIEHLDDDLILEEVKTFLQRTEWGCDEEVLIVAWEETDDSPSTQLWIPAEGRGLPVVEGVYEQLLEGEEKIFLGSRPSQLPEALNRELIAASRAVGLALQSLGYVGRCSFDFIVSPDGEDRRKIRFTECNGRWGGTSTPMFLVDRLIRGSRPAYRAQDFMHRDLVGISFPELLDRIGDALYRPDTGQGTFVFYNVGPLENCGKFDVIALADCPTQADEQIHVELPRRLGLR